MLDVIAAPTWPKKFAHLEHAIADRGDVTQQAAVGLFQSTQQSESCRPALQFGQPSVEVRQGSDCERGARVLVRGRIVKSVSGAVAERPSMRNKASCVVTAQRDAAAPSVPGASVGQFG